MDRILIPELPLEARVGVTSAEREEAQPLRVGLVLHLDLAPAGARDDIAETVDYDAVCAVVAEVVRARPRRLIESVAEDVARAVLTSFDVDRVDVRVEKPGALRERHVPYAAVEVSRTRDD